MDIQKYDNAGEKRFEGISRETLVKLLQEYTSLYLQLEGVGHTWVEDKLGQEEAFQFTKTVWDRMPDREMRAISKALNIQGNDVATMQKMCIVAPGWPCDMKGWDVRWDLKNNNHTVCTVYQCRVLDMYTKSGNEWLLHKICHESEPPCIQKYADFVNPNIKVRALKLPPRESKDDICCQWEFKLEV